MQYFFPIIISMMVAGFFMMSYLESSFGEETDALAVFDRIEDGKQAVILVEELNKEWVVPTHALPPGSKVNMWFDVKVNDEKLEVVRINHEATKEALEKVREGQEKLRKCDPAR